MCDSKVKAIKTVLENSIRVADLRCSLFVAALLTYRRPTTLKPFPSFFIRDGTKQYDLLIEIVKKIPPLKILTEKLQESNYVKHNQDVIDLLHFILVESSEPSLIAVSNETIDSVLQKVPSELEACKPQYIFEVLHSRTQTENKWSTLSDQGKTFYAYHGSKFENFHSILHHGLQQHMNKNMLFGSGTYLSSELSVCLLYSPGSLNWEQSNLGQTLSCVALCELIDSPNGLISQKTKTKGVSDGPCHSKTKASDSMAGEIPHKYYIVHNDDLVRIRYLLIYAQNSSKTINKSIVSQNNFLIKFIIRYKFLAMMILYIAILAVIGLRNNDSFYYYYKILYKKVSDIFL